MLRSAEQSELKPYAVAISDQSRSGLDLDVSGYSFPVAIARNDGGISRGRNAAVAALPDEVDVVAVPNDDSWYPPEVLTTIAQRFALDTTLVALACTANTGGGTRTLPEAGSLLDRRSVWRAIEWCMFVRRSAFVAAGGFNEQLGTGGPTPWQSGEGTDLLLRLMSAGSRIVSASDVAVHGPGERRDLSDDEWVRKHRRYARGTGFVYRLHDYPLSSRLRIVLAPWARIRTFDERPAMAVRVAAARSFGRVEGLIARPLERRRQRRPDRQL